MAGSGSPGNPRIRAAANQPLRGLSRARPPGDPEADPGADGEQIDIAFMEIMLCLAKVLHEADPQFTPRLNYAAGKAFNRLKSGGNDGAAELVYQFGRALLDPDQFPRDDGLPD